MTFKTKKELIAFISMNLFGAPFTWIAAYAFLETYGIALCVLLFLGSLFLWKRWGNKKEARLLFSPKIKSLI